MLLSLAISEMQLHLVGFNFVDDTDLMTALTPNTPGKQILPKSKLSLDRWAGGPVATGGELAPDKSFCCLLAFKWTNIRCACQSLKDMPGEVTMKDRHRVSHPLCRPNKDTAKKTLGVITSMDGNQQSQIACLTKVSTTFDHRVCATPCPKLHVLCAFSASHMKSIKCSLLVTCLSLPAWDAIVNPAVAPSLQRARISKTPSCTPLFAPLLPRGLGWKHLFHLQGLVHISTHIQESSAGGQTSSLLQQSCEALIMEAGIPIEPGASTFERPPRGCCQHDNALPLTASTFCGRLWSSCFSGTTMLVSWTFLWQLVSRRQCSHSSTRLDCAHR